MTNTTETAPTIETTARCAPWGQVGTYRVAVEPDGTVKVWDSVAGHYTYRHGLSATTQRKIARSVGR